MHQFYLFTTSGHLSAIQIYPFYSYILLSDPLHFEGYFHFSFSADPSFQVNMDDFPDIDFLEQFIEYVFANSGALVSFVPALLLPLVEERQRYRTGAALQFDIFVVIADRLSCCGSQIFFPSIPTEYSTTTYRHSVKSKG